MMDEDARIQFKMKFYWLTIQLNIIILLVAVSIIGFFLIHSPYTVPLITGMIILAAILSWNFARKYRKTKTWLEEHTDKGKDT